MGFPIADFLSIGYFLLAVVHACQLFENDLMATCKRSKETNLNFIARFWSAQHFNFKCYSIEKEVLEKFRFWTKSCTKSVNRTFSFKLVFHILLLNLNIWRNNQRFSRKLFTLLPDKLFQQRDLKSDFTWCEMSNGYYHRTRKRLSTNIFCFYEI